MSQFWRRFNGLRREHTWQRQQASIGHRFPPDRCPYAYALAVAAATVAAAECARAFSEGVDYECNVGITEYGSLGRLP